MKKSSMLKSLVLALALAVSAAGTALGCDWENCGGCLEPFKRFYIANVNGKFWHYDNTRQERSEPYDGSVYEYYNGMAVPLPITVNISIEHYDRDVWVAFGDDDCRLCTSWKASLYCRIKRAGDWLCGWMRVRSVYGENAEDLFGRLNGFPANIFKTVIDIPSDPNVESRLNFRIRKGDEIYIRVSFEDGTTVQGREENTDDDLDLSGENEVIEAGTYNFSDTGLSGEDGGWYPSNVMMVRWNGERTVGGPRRNAK